MKPQEYIDYFNSIVNSKIEDLNEPFNKQDYYDYTKLNWARFNRYFKTKPLTESFLQTLSRISEPQNWLLITEPWCGDAAHNVAFIIIATENNPLINLTIELRDSDPFSIEKYLTRGTKSIPKLVIRDKDGNDLETWGPRPEECHILYKKLLDEKASSEELMLQIHTWYNNNKGYSLQQELEEVILKTISNS